MRYYETVQGVNNTMKKVTRIACYCLLTIGLLATHSANESQDVAIDFVKNITNGAVAIIAKDLPDSDKRKQLTALLEQSVDTQWIAKFSMGQHWHQLSTLEQDNYVETFKHYLIGRYVPRFEDFHDAYYDIKGAELESDNSYVVHAQISTKTNETIDVAFKIHTHNNKDYKLYDVVAKGVSLLHTQRSEFASVLARKGPKFLIKKLEKRTKVATK